MTGSRADEADQYSCFFGSLSAKRVTRSTNSFNKSGYLWWFQNLGERGRMNSPMVSQSTAGRISENTTVNENNVRLTYLFWESSTQRLDQHLAIFPISKREVANLSVMPLTDVVVEKTICSRVFVHDVESNCHMREAPTCGFQANASVNEECQCALHQRPYPPVRQCGGGIVAARAYVGLDARNS